MCGVGQDAATACKQHVKKLWESGERYYGWPCATALPLLFLVAASGFFQYGSWAQAGGWLDRQSWWRLTAGPARPPAWLSTAACVQVGALAAEFAEMPPRAAGRAKKRAKKEHKPAADAAAAGGPAAAGTAAAGTAPEVGGSTGCRGLVFCPPARPPTFTPPRLAVLFLSTKAGQSGPKVCQPHPFLPLSPALPPGPLWRPSVFRCFVCCSTA